MSTQTVNNNIKKLIQTHTHKTDDFDRHHRLFILFSYFVATTEDEEQFEVVEVSPAESEPDESVPANQFDIELAAEHSVCEF